jgi:hypothetical protein
MMDSDQITEGLMQDLLVLVLLLSRSGVRECRWALEEEKQFRHTGEDPLCLARFLEIIRRLCNLH